AAGNGVAWEGCAQGLRHFVFVEVAYEFGEVGDAIEFGENDVDRNLGAELLGEFAEHLVGVACSGERCIRGSGAQKNLGANADNGGADRRLLTHGGACGLGTGFADEAAPELRSLANGVARFGKDTGVRVPQINDGSGDDVLVAVDLTGEELGIEAGFEDNRGFGGVAFTENIEKRQGVDRFGAGALRGG